MILRWGVKREWGPRAWRNDDGGFTFGLSFGYCGLYFSTHNTESSRDE